MTTDAVCTLPTLCTHCQLPVPPGLVKEGEASFCCAGCEMVYQLLHQHDAMALYQETLEDKAAPQAAAAYASFDTPAFLENHCTPLADGLMEVAFYVDGVHCAACVWLLEKLPTLCDGVLEARLEFRRARLRVIWSPANVALSRVALILDRLGYPPHPYRELHHEKRFAAAEKTMLIRIGVAGAVAGNAMLMAFALYGGLFGGMSPAFQALFRWLSLAVSLPAVLWAAQPFFRGAMAALMTRVLHMDLPIALGISVGFGSSAWNTVTGRGEIYFDSVATLIFLLLVGRWLQHRQQRQAAEATELLYHMSPAEARLIQGEGVDLVPVEQLQPGDLIEVRAGDVFPVDGVIQEGASRVDRSMLSGESRPVKVSVGEEVFAGSLNVVSALRVEVAQTGHATRLGKLLTMVEEASAQRAPIVQMADRIAGVFVAVVLCLAMATWLLWWWLGSDAALTHATALLIITCPCALGMATPLAISAALGQAARRGILIKGGEVLEALARPGRIWFDKTGTLTEGKMTLIHWHGDDAVKPYVHAIEAQCVHPIASALTAVLPAGEGLGDVEIQQALGRGLTASLGGKRWCIGAPDFVASSADALPSWWQVQLDDVAAAALTPVAIAADGEILALAGLGDALQPGIRQLFDGLRQQGWALGILSGDHPSVVQAVGASLGLAPEDCRGGLMPEEKRDVVKAGVEEGLVVMVGDGVNDAPALASATVGVGVRGGAEAALSVADIYMAERGAIDLGELIAGASRTVRVIQRNFAFSLAFNVVGVSLAVAGILTPLLAAILMPLSSLTVISHSFRARMFQHRGDEPQTDGGSEPSDDAPSSRLDDGRASSSLMIRMPGVSRSSN